MLITYDYLLVLVGLLVLGAGWIRSRQPYRRQIGIILFGSTFPLLGGLVYVLGFNPFPRLDITPISFLFTGIVIAFGIFKFRLFKLVPIARHVLIEHMRDGVLVLDANNNLADIIPSAEKFLNVRAEDCLGRPAMEVLKAWSALVRRFENVFETQTETQIGKNPARIFDFYIHSLRSGQKISGRPIVFKDITARRQAEKDLAHQNEELSSINRINLAVTAGLDMEQTIKALYEKCNLMVPIDIIYVALYNEQNSLISVPVYYEHVQYQTGLLRDIKERPGTIGNIIRTRRTLYLHDSVNPVTGPLNRLTDGEKRVKSYIGVPLTVRDKVVGLMCIQSYRPAAYSEDQVHLLERIAVYATIAIENARLYAEVQRLAFVDELTGIYNYWGLVELGNREVERARWFNHPLSALFFDIDGFRQFNNQYSHVTGNLVLQAIAQTTRKSLRSGRVCPLWRRRIRHSSARNQPGRRPSHSPASLRQYCCHQDPHRTG